MVEVTGPPWVMIFTMSKPWKLAMVRVTRRKSVVGVSSGQVMWRKRCQPPAPSRAAASYRSPGMAWSPAR